MSTPPEPKTEREHGGDYIADVLGQNRAGPGRPANIGFRKLFEDIGSPQTYNEALLNRLALSMIDGSARHAHDTESSLPAGYTYLGQLINHDITHDVRGGNHPVNARPGYRYTGTPQLDLLSVYGNNFDFLDDKGRFTLSLVSKRYYDMPRPQPNPDGKPGQADIADNRNEDNLAISQLQVLFMALHNVSCDANKIDSRTDAISLVYPAVAKCFCHLARHDYLPRVVNHAVLRRVAAGTRYFYFPERDGLYMPLEFSGAAFRFGHSQVRPRYRWSLNPAGYPFEITALQLIDATGLGNLPHPGVGLTKPWMMNWRYFFPGSAAESAVTNRAMRINPLLSFDLSQLPHSGAGILAFRNLLRGWKQYDLPSAQALMQRAGMADPLPEAELLAAAGDFMDAATLGWFVESGLHRDTPLWYYILLEAHASYGNHLGELGSQIVSEVIVQLAERSMQELEHCKVPPIALFDGPIANKTLRIRDVLDHVLSKEPGKFAT